VEVVLDEVGGEIVDLLRLVRLEGVENVQPAFLQDHLLLEHIPALLFGHLLAAVQEQMQQLQGRFKQELIRIAILEDGKHCLQNAQLAVIAEHFPGIAEGEDIDEDDGCLLPHQHVL
jgi:hypothetical protein